MTDKSYPKADEHPPKTTTPMERELGKKIDELKAQIEALNKRVSKIEM